MTRAPRALHRIAASIPLWTLLAARLGAQDEPPRPPVLTLDEVVVTPTRASEGAQAGRLPFVTYVLEEDEIRQRRAATTLPEILDETPGVSVQKTGNGLDSPFLRGFTGFRTLLLIDGIRFNNAVFRDGPNQYWSTVDPLSIHRVETVLGPASVLYGSDAVGGTVNLLTLSDFPQGVHPGLFYRFGSAATSQTLRADTRGRVALDGGGELGYSAGVSWYDHGDLRGGRHVGVQEQTGYEALAGDAKLSWSLSERLRLTLAHQSWDADRVPRTHATRDGISWRGTRVGTDRRRDFFQDRHLAYARAEAGFETEWIQSLSLTFSYQVQKEEEDRIQSNHRRTLQGFDDATGGIALVARSPETAAGVWTVGAEHYHDWVDSFRRDTTAAGAVTVAPRGPVADESQYGLLGVFVQEEWQPVDWLELIAGGRYNFIYALADHADIDENPTDARRFDDLDETFESVVGSGRAILHPLEWLSPYAGVSQGFRAPNLSDLTRFDIARSGDLEVPNTSLKPESFVTAELGAHLRGEGWRASGAWFHTWIDDMIIRSPSGQVDADGNRIVRKDNVGDGFANGVELATEWDFYRSAEQGTLTARGHGTWLEGRVASFNAQDRRVRRALDKMSPAWFLLGLRWTHPAELAWLELSFRKTFEQDQLSPGDQADNQRIPPEGSPGSCLIGLHGGWRPCAPLHLFAGVENLTDRDYRVHGSGINGPGTNAVVGAELRW